MADAIPTLSISTEKICFVVLKAREFDVKDADTSSDEDGSNPADDRMVEVVVGVNPFALDELLEQGAVETAGTAIVDILDAGLLA